MSLNQTQFSTTYVLDSVTPLGANSSFTGGTVDTQRYSASFIEAEANSDQTGTLLIDFSEDNFVTVAFSVSAACGPPSPPVVAGTNANSANIKYPLFGRYVRVRYVNGGTSQTKFQVSHRLSNA